jgi:WD40 repeat protein
MRVLTASYDKTARVWDAASGATLAILRGHFGEVRSAVFDASGTHVLTASQDSTARVWDAASGAELAVLSGHAAFVASAEFDPTGARILTASEDETARVWDTASGATAMDAIIINPASFCVNAAEDSIPLSGGDLALRERQRVRKCQRIQGMEHARVRPTPQCRLTVGRELIHAALRALEPAIDIAQ